MCSISRRLPSAVLCLVAFHGFGFAQSLNITDSLSLSWSRLEGPPAFVSQYSEGGGKIFAVSEEMLFSSLDGGLHWTPNHALGRKKIKQLFANDLTVVVITEEKRVIEPSHPFSGIEWHQIYRSLDGGLSWDKVFTFEQEPETQFLSKDYELFSPNDSTIAFEYLQSRIFPEFFEKQLWISKNYGSTWFNPPGRFDLFHSIKDTVSYIRPINNVFFGFVSSYANLNSPQQINLSGTGTSVVDILMVAHVDGIFHLFSKNKTLWRTSDQGFNWSSGQFQFPGELNKIVWHDGLFYAVTSTGVYQLDMGDINNATKVYNGQHGRTAMPRTFRPLQSGFWANTDLNQTVFSSNNGLDWSVRSAGLSSKVGYVGAICHRAYARSLGPANMLGGWYQAEATGADWAYLQPTNFNYTIYPWFDLGEAGGHAYRYFPVKIQRSSDCGASWEDLPVNVSAQPKGVFWHNGRLIIFNAFSKQTHISDDNGTSWGLGTLPSSGILSLTNIGNSLIAAFPDKIYLSEDLGDTWKVRNLPVSMRTVYANGANIVAIHHPDEYEELEIYRSSDLGDTWATILELPVAMGGQLHKRQISSGGGLILLNANGYLFASANDGESWAKLLDVPFGRRISNFDLGLFDEFSPQASAYLIKNGQVYAASEANGLWAVPLDSVLSALVTTSTTDLSSQTKSSWQLSPNPTAHDIWLKNNKQNAGVDRDKVRFRVLDLTGRVWREQPVPQMSSTVGHQLDLEGLPSGLYFIEILEKNGGATMRFLKQ